MTYRTLTPMYKELYGERIVIRPYRESDAPTLHAAIAESREHLRLWLSFADEHQTVEETQDWIVRMQAGWLLREQFYNGIWRMEDNNFLGGVSLHVRDWKIAYFMIGYWLRASATGQGYMAEAVQRLTDFAFNGLKANRVEILCSVDNEASAAVARRAGYVLEGTRRNDYQLPSGEISSSFVFSLIPEDRGG